MSKVTFKKGEQTRKVILDAAYSLIIKQGYAATSMRQIATKAGLALGSIYNHFSSKEDVFRVIIEERHPFFQILPALNSGPGNTMEAYIRNSAHAIIDELGNHPDFLNLMLTEVVEFKGKHVPLLFKKIFPLAAPLAHQVADLPGKLNPIPPFVLVRAFFGMFFSYYITGILLRGDVPAEVQADALDYFVDIYLYGILSKESV
jgi:AcrR family transcriptional regulator